MTDGAPEPLRATVRRESPSRIDHAAVEQAAHGAGMS